MKSIQCTLVHGIPNPMKIKLTNRFCAVSEQKWYFFLGGAWPILWKVPIWSHAFLPYPLRDPVFFFYYTVRCDQTLKISHIIFWSIVVKMAGILFGDRLATFFACMNCFVSFQLEDWRCLSAWHLPKVHTCETNACTKFHLKMNTSYLKSSKHLLIQNKVLKSEVLICKWFERKRWRHTYLLLVCVVKHWDTSILQLKGNETVYTCEKSSKTVSKQNSSHFYYDRPKMIWLIFRVWSHLTV